MITLIRVTALQGTDTILLPVHAALDLGGSKVLQFRGQQPAALQSQSSATSTLIKICFLLKLKPSGHTMQNFGKDLPTDLGTKVGQFEFKKGLYYQILTLKVEFHYRSAFAISHTLQELTSPKIAAIDSSKKKKSLSESGQGKGVSCTSKAPRARDTE